MPEIRNVNVRIDSIREIGIPPVRSVFTGLPEPIVKDVPIPVTVTIGTPIDNVPGCVEVSLDDAINDPNGNVTFCDGNVPSFNPPDYDPNQMTLTGPPEPLAEAPKLESLKPPTLPETPLKGPTPDVPIVTVTEEEKPETVELVEEPTFVEKYLPSAEEVSTTVTIAVAAATAAVFGKPLAELLLKLIKPLVKKVIQKAKDKMGVTPEVLSVAERRQLQRDLRK